MKQKIILQWCQIIAGLFIFAFGVHLTIFANLGLAPWDCLGMGLSNYLPLNYGLSMTASALVILGIDVLLKERIGFGTLFDAFLSGNFIQFFNDINPLPKNENLWLGIVLLFAGYVFIALGMAFYMKGEQCCGPRDGLLIALAKRLPKIPVGFVEIMLYAVVLLIGWLLGGPVGIGTLISVFGAGSVMQLVYNLIRFEPRSIRHRDIIEVTKELTTQSVTLISKQRKSSDI